MVGLACGGGPGWGTIDGFHPAETPMEDINPVRVQIADLKGRLELLRGYL
jgi:hypothetical protein